MILGMANSVNLLRVLAYGESQRKKSWWLGAAAEAGFNVLILNGDKPAQIYSLLSPEAQRRLRIVNVIGEYNYSELVARLLRGGDTYWDITAGKRLSSPAQAPDHDVFKLNLGKLNSNWVIGFDSWTAIAVSTVNRLAAEKGIDLSDVAKIEWDLYGPTGMYLDWVLQQITKLQAHVVVIGHPDTWEKMKKNAQGKLTTEIEFTRVQPISSSRPHAKKLAKFFTDTLYFDMLGTTHYIDTTATSERDAGSTTVPPKRYKWDDLPFGKMIEAAKIPKPTSENDPLDPNSPCLFIPAGSQPPVGEPAKVVTNSGKAPVLQATQPVSGLQGLFNKAK